MRIEVGPRRLGRRVGARHDHLHDMELRVEALGESGGPANGLLGRLRTVGSHHHATRDLLQGNDRLELALDRR